MKAKVMNPVMYFDELDKVSGTHRGDEIINILVHLTDSTQNDKYQDRYFSDIDFDLSRSLIIFSYNDESLINPILKDRMVRIKTNGYNIKEKIIIAQNYLVKALLKQFGFKDNDIEFTDEVISYTTMRIPAEEGVRNLKRALEAVISNINLKCLLSDEDTHFPLKVDTKTIDLFVKHNKENSQYNNSMYI
jgi:ATP-dependent Lon protease